MCHPLPSPLLLNPESFFVRAWTRPRWGARHILYHYYYQQTGHTQVYQSTVMQQHLMYTCLPTYIYVTLRQKSHSGQPHYNTTAIQVNSWPWAKHYGGWAGVAEQNNNSDLSIGALCDFLQVILSPCGDAFEEDLLWHTSSQRHAHPVQQLKQNRRQPHLRISIKHNGNTSDDSCPVYTSPSAWGIPVQLTGCQSPRTSFYI